MGMKSRKKPDLNAAFSALERADKAVKAQEAKVEAEREKLQKLESELNQAAAAFAKATPPALKRHLAGVASAPRTKSPAPKPNGQPEGKRAKKQQAVRAEVLNTMIMETAEPNKGWSKSELMPYVKKLKVSENNFTTSYLGKMVEEGLLRTKGERSQMRYFITTKGQEWMAD